MELEGKGGYVDTWLFLAMLYHKQDKWDEAQQWMDKVEAWAKKWQWRSWQEKLRWQLCLKQARQILATVPPMPEVDM